MVLTLTLSRTNSVVYSGIALLNIVDVRNGTTKYPSTERSNKSTCEGL